MGVDPEAAEIVLSSGIDIVMAPMDIARQARITPDTIQAMKELNRVGEML
jgi:non-specific riboncleoside hydrolase